MQPGCNAGAAGSGSGDAGQEGGGAQHLDPYDREQKPRQHEGLDRLRRQRAEHYKRAAAALRNNATQATGASADREVTLQAAAAAEGGSEGRGNLGSADGSALPAKELPLAGLNGAAGTAAAGAGEVYARDEDLDDLALPAIRAGGGTVPAEEQPRAGADGAAGARAAGAAGMGEGQAGGSAGAVYAAVEDMDDLELPAIGAVRHKALPMLGDVRPPCCPHAPQMLFLLP